MSIINAVNLCYPFRQENKTDKEINNIVNDFEKVLKTTNDIISMNIDFSTYNGKELNQNKKEEIEKQNKQIQKLRKQILSSKMLISKKNKLCSLFNDTGKESVLDLSSVIGMSPRVSIEELKHVADKLDYCLFNEEVFSNEIEAKDKIIAESAATFLKTQGYNIYYLSPLSSFDYSAFINSGKGLYDCPSYWGNHLQTFNTLALSLNVFRDLYSIVDVLKKENEEIRKAIDSDRKRVDVFHKQFQDYANHVYKNLKIIEQPLNDYIRKENEKLMERFIKTRNLALSNNEKYKNSRYLTVETKEAYSKKTKEYLGTWDQIMFYEDTEDVKVVVHQETIDRFLPVPTNAGEYKTFQSEYFKINELNETKDIKKLEAKYTIANIKKLMVSELSDNYLMVAVKGDILDPEDEDAIVLTHWGKGLSKETMIALGVDNV